MKNLSTTKVGPTLVGAHPSSEAATFDPVPLRTLPVLALRMPDAQTSRLLAALGPFLLGGGRVFCLDGGNLFNPYRLADWLRRSGTDPTPILENRLFVSRAFTCHQLAGATEMLLSPLVEQPEPPLTLLLGIEKLFLDEDIPLFERRHLFDRILSEARRLQKRGLPILVTCGENAGPPWLDALRRSAFVLPDLSSALARIQRISHGSDVAHLQHLA